MKKLLLFFILFLGSFFEAEGQYYTGYHDTLDFEKTEPFLILNSASTWQVGTPGKTFLDTAFHGTKAIMTDTLNPYPANDTSYFIVIVPPPGTQTCATSLEFEHKYDIDSSDYGIIEASYDKGNTWFTLRDTNFSSSWYAPAWFQWEYDFHHSTGNSSKHDTLITGKSDGWIRSRFYWQWFIAVKTDSIILMPDTLLIRFTFISDSVNEGKEGWLIDNIVLNAADPANCTNISQKNTTQKITVSPNPFYEYATIFTNSLFRNAKIIVKNIQGQTVFSMENITGKSFLLPRNNLPSGIYLLRILQENAPPVTLKVSVK